MPSVEERVATLEGRIQEQAVFMADVRGSTVEAIRDLSSRMSIGGSSTSIDGSTGWNDL